MELHKDIPVFLFKHISEWEAWLEQNHDKFSAIWLKFAKKKSGEVSLSYPEAVLVALCYGWIDSLLNKYDEKFYVIKFTPRKSTSVWSKTNQELVRNLTKVGKMQASGLAAVENAKTNGRWHTAYDGSSTMQMPRDFLKELAKDKKAEAFFRSLNRANTYAIAWRLQTAKRPATRQKRMESILIMLKKGEKFH